MAREEKSIDKSIFELQTFMWANQFNNKLRPQTVLAILDELHETRRAAGEPPPEPVLRQAFHQMKTTLLGAIRADSEISPETKVALEKEINERFTSKQNDRY